MHYERVVVLADASEVSTDYLLNRTDDSTPYKRPRRKRPAVSEAEEDEQGWEPVAALTFSL